MLLATLLLATLQDPPTRPTPPSRTADANPPAAPVLASDGKPLEPGRIPEDTAPEVRADWGRVLAATIGANEKRAPIEGFDLEVHARVSAPGQSNDVNGTYRYQAPGFVRCTIEKDKTLLRGPDGDFLIASDLAGGFAKLDRARENEQDLKLLDDLLTISRNFIALSDPRQLRLVSLKRATAPAIVPKGYEKRVAALSWIEVRSPDFRLTRSAAAQLYRIELGSDPQSFQPQFALIHETAQGLGPSSVFIELKAWRARGEFQVPDSILFYELEDGTGPAPRGELVRSGAQPSVAALAFRREPSSDLFLSSATINPARTEFSFRPQGKPKSD